MINLARAPNHTKAKVTMAAMFARAHLELLVASRTLARSSRRLATVNTHFHLDRDAGGTRDAISRLIEVFGRI